jgi:hypothetical protein
MSKKELNIIEFVSELNLLQGAELSPTQGTILKATYGLELNQAEFEIYCRATGRKTYQAREQLEVTVIVGRQGGKTSRIGALCAVYESFRHALRPGERAYVYLIAPVTDQARIAFRFIRDYICASPVLYKKVKKIRKSEIDLDNGITIRCCPCSQISIRGFRVVAAVLDEIGFWRNEITAANPAEDVLNALRPAMATFPIHKLIKISTPNRKDGVLWRDYQQREQLDYLVWQISTAEMNPTISVDFLDKEEQRDPESFRREYLAQFTDQIEGWIRPEILDQCVPKSYTERPPVGSAVYAAAVDPAFKGNDFALAIAHRQDGLIIVDYVVSWTGTREAPLGYEQVCGVIAGIVKGYGLNVVVGDQHCAPILQQQFQELGIVYREFTFGSGTRLDLFVNLKHLIYQKQISLLDKPDLLRQFLSLEEHRTPRGNIDVRPAYRSKDDLAVVVAVVAYQLSKMDHRPMSPPISLAEPPKFWTDPYNCPWMIDCANCPTCHDEGECLGYAGPPLAGCK